MKLRPISAAILFALTSLSLSAQADDARRPYVVQLADKPIASYDGSVNGLAVEIGAHASRINPRAFIFKLHFDRNRPFQRNAGEVARKLGRVLAAFFGGNDDVGACNRWRRAIEKRGREGI